MGYSVPPPNVTGMRTVLLAALIDGDLGLAYDLSTGLLEDGVPFEVLVTEVITPVQTEVGTRWADGDLTIADEHAATAAVENLVALLSGTLAPADGPTVVIACPDGDTHSLPGRVVAATLAIRGFRSMFLGASLPAADLGEYLEHQRPMALALSVSMASALFRATQSVAVAHTLQIPVIVGGQALSRHPERARKLGADFCATDAVDAAETLDRWTVLAPDELASDAVPHPECARIERNAAQLTATALASLTGADALSVQRLAEELNRVLSVVQGSLTLEDREMLVEHVAAWRSADRAHGLAPELVDASIAGLVLAMSDQIPHARALLDSLAS